jgi:hypothetical protein
MRLEIVFGPDALHARMADTNLFGHATHAPVRGVLITLPLRTSKTYGNVSPLPTKMVTPCLTCCWP